MSRVRVKWEWSDYFSRISKKYILKKSISIQHFFFFFAHRDWIRVILAFYRELTGYLCIIKYHRIGRFQEFTITSFGEWPISPTIPTFGSPPIFHISIWDFICQIHTLFICNGSSSLLFEVFYCIFVFPQI